MAEQNNRRFSIRFSGVGQENGIQHDGKMSVDYAYMINADEDIYQSSWGLYDVSRQYIPYSAVFDLKNDSQYRKYSPLILNFMYDENNNLQSYEGMYALSNQGSSSYSFYRREYEVFQKGMDRNGIPVYEEYKGEWQPAAININMGSFRDFNIQNDKTYQYIMYPADDLTHEIRPDEKVVQIFANYNGLIFNNGKFVPGNSETANKNGSPLTVGWGDWNIAELIPMENERNIPIIKKTYKVNLDQIWFFKYNLETGSQTQNIGRNEIQTLGRFSKIGYGKTNYLSGEVSAFIGSEIRPYRGDSYIERTWRSRRESLTTNEKALMLEQWRNLVNSKNPKLLRDMKGQSWIVQIMSSTNSPKHNYTNIPDTISFQWKQIDTTENAIIYSDPISVYSRCSEDESSKTIEKIPMFKTKFNNLK